MPDVLDLLANALSLPDAAKLIRRSEPTLYRLATQGKIEYIRVGFRIYFTREALIAFVENSKPKTTRPPRRRSNAERSAAVDAAAKKCKALGC
jgi:excisionase family DNA binding protein